MSNHLYTYPHSSLSHYPYNDNDYPEELMLRHHDMSHHFSYNDHSDNNIWLNNFISTKYLDEFLNNDDGPPIQDEKEKDMGHVLISQDKENHIKKFIPHDDHEKMKIGDDDSESNDDKKSQTGNNNEILSENIERSNNNNQKSHEFEVRSDSEIKQLDPSHVKTNDTKENINQEPFPLGKIGKKGRRRGPRNNWNKMTKILFDEMVNYERKNPDIKQSELQRLFNVNRSTYWRWKKQYNII